MPFVERLAKDPSAGCFAEVGAAIQSSSQLDAAEWIPACAEMTMAAHPALTTHTSYHHPASDVHDTLSPILGPPFTPG
jgi:hypothetical protein